jgi:hypothetical protein
MCKSLAMNLRITNQQLAGGCEKLCDACENSGFCVQTIFLLGYSHRACHPSDR